MILCLSISHKNASLPLLESVTFKNEKEALKELFSIDYLEECILIQTCHRVEIYCVTNEIEAAVEYLVKFWSKKVGVSSDILKDTLRIYHGKDAINHLFSTAAGIESMVVGEDQILGQIRKAYVQAKEVGTAGLILGKAFMKAINVGRRIRTETRINEGSLSISSVAVDLAVKRFRDLEGRAALVIGAGEAGSIVAENLHSKGVKKIFIANRTYKRGVRLAQKVSAIPIRFDDIIEILPEVDLVFAAVSTDKPILGIKEIKDALWRRNRKDLLIVDISQPRFFDEKVASLDNVILKNIDDLKEVVSENLSKRMGELKKAKKIVSDELRLFERQLARMMAEPLISEICNKMDKIRRRELVRALRKMKEKDAKKREIMDRFSRELMERMLQDTLERLRDAVLNNENYLLSAAEKLFGIENKK